MNSISLFNYCDPVAFLRDLFTELRAKEPDLTVRRWSIRMGYESPLRLVSVLKGTKPLRVDDLDRIEKGIDLSSNEIRYLELLILRARSKSDREKNAIDFVLSQVRPTELKNEPVNSSLDTPDEELFSDWTDAAVISALRLSSIQRDPGLLKQNLLWESDEARVERSFNKVRRFGIYDEARKEMKFDSVTTKSDRPHLGARSYFAQINRLAIEAIALPLAEREFQCFSIPARKADTPEFKQLIRRFREELSAFATQDGDVVFQFNLEMFPLTKQIREVAVSPEPFEEVTSTGRPLSSNRGARSGASVQSSSDPVSHR